MQVLSRLCVASTNVRNAVAGVCLFSQTRSVFSGFEYSLLLLCTRWQQRVTGWVLFGLALLNSQNFLPFAIQSGDNLDQRYSTSSISPHPDPEAFRLSPNQFIQRQTISELQTHFCVLCFKLPCQNNCCEANERDNCCIYVVRLLMAKHTELLYRLFCLQRSLLNVKIAHVFFLISNHVEHGNFDLMSERSKMVIYCTCNFTCSLPFLWQ